jgi:hypothetical protein
MQGWRVDVHSMSCTFMCGTRPERLCACRNAGGALGVHGACSVRARASAGPTAGVGGGQALGNIDGGQRTLMARQQQVACLLRLCPHGRAPG